MATKGETVLLTLAGLLEGLGTLRRNEGFPQTIPADGLMHLHDGNPGEPEATLSPLTWHFEHVAEIDIFAQGDGRDSIFDDLTVAIAEAIAADTTLGGAVDWAGVQPPRPADVPIDGALPIKAGTLPVTLIYSTTETLT